ncbi:MAG: PEP-CTERM sorting domain-containing protein [Akkermansiaceae bacterium]|nr:PEP-CTERM sorting domain-containing protein [Akkermansiaceae bacterium]
MKQNKIIRFALLASAAMFAVGSVQGAVTAGSLVLFFQKPGDTDTVFVNLGNAATLYRGAAAGSSAANQALDIININSTLVSAFGSGWASDQNVYAGLAGVLENSTNTTVVNGDQYRTLYVSRSRASVGTVGASGSTSYNLLAAGSLTGGATNIRGLITNFATQLGSADQGIVSVDLSVIDNQNPTTLAGVQSTAFGQFTTGVQQRGSASVFGTFGLAGEVEFALDLQRLVPDGTVNTDEVAGQSRFGSYEGTVTIGSNGSVSFITIPEPSSITLAGIAGLALAFRRRRNA